MDLVVPLLAALISAAAVTWLIFRLSRQVDGWTGRQFALVWLFGACAVILLLIATAHVPKGHELVTTRCDPARDTNCRATAAPQVSTNGDTVCCYPGVTVFSLEHNTPEGEGMKIGLIMLAVGTVFGLIVLTNQWMRRAVGGDSSIREES